MSKELKVSDFLAMLNTSEEIGYLNSNGNPVTVQIVDEEGELYYIRDVTYNFAAGSVVVEFTHDTDDDSYDEIED